jgi:hypothetical protein
MHNFLCLIDTDDRQFYIRSALAKLKARYPSALGGACFSPMAVRMDKSKYTALMKAADECDFAVVYFHGGCQNLPEFHKFWERVTKRVPCFFVSPIRRKLRS